MTIDRLAAKGMRFTNAFLTASSYSPSHASIVTGRYPHNTDAEQLHWPLPPEQGTFVEILKKAGYWTASAGKWHLGDTVRDRFDRGPRSGRFWFSASDGRGRIAAGNDSPRKERLCTLAPDASQPEKARQNPRTFATKALNKTG